MSSVLWKSLFVSPVILVTTMLLATGVMAAPKTDRISSPVNSNTANKIAADAPDPTQATPDILKPSDWQYTSLEGLGQKYGCNPNFNNQPVSQIDFARSLNTCINRVETRVALQQSTPPAPLPADAVTREDLEVLKRLTQEFRAQLTEIDGKIVAADNKIAQLQATQFSTTTKLKGEAIFNVTGAVSGSKANNTVFGDRVRLLFQSSFNGQDALYTRLATGNQGGLSGNFKNGTTGEGTQVSEGAPFGSNTTGLDWLAYQFPINKTGTVYVAATGGLLGDFAPSYGSNFDDATGGNGALTSFAEANPIYKIGGGTGIGTLIPVADTGLTSVNLGYFAGGSPNSPTAGNGLFNGGYSLFGQLNFKVNDKLTAGVTYINSYTTAGNAIYGFGGTGALLGTGQGNDGLSLANSNPNGLTANSFGASAAYNVSDKLAFNGFVMNTSANKGVGIGNQSIWSYGAGVSLPNIDGKGSLVGFLVGAEPYVGGTGSVPFHLEGFYKYKVSDNLSITPGLIYLTAPNQTSGNSAVVGVVRTTFTF